MKPLLTSVTISKYNTIGEFYGCCEYFNNIIQCQWYKDRFFIDYDKETSEHYLAIKMIDDSLSISFSIEYCPQCGKEIKIKKVKRKK